MKSRLTLPRAFCLLISLICIVSLTAQEKAPSGRGGLDESDRLMQEYMVKRAEWLELRQTAIEKIKLAKDEKERKQHFEKLADDEKPVLARMAEAARSFQAAEKAKREKLAEAKPRN